MGWGTDPHPRGSLFDDDFGPEEADADVQDGETQREGGVIASVSTGTPPQRVVRVLAYCPQSGAESIVLDKTCCFIPGSYINNSVISCETEGFVEAHICKLRVILDASVKACDGVCITSCSCFYSHASPLGAAKG